RSQFARTVNLILIGPDLAEDVDCSYCRGTHRAFCLQTHLPRLPYSVLERGGAPGIEVKDTEARIHRIASRTHTVLAAPTPRSQFTLCHQNDGSCAEHDRPDRPRCSVG